MPNQGENCFTFIYATDVHLGHQVENVIDEAKQDAFTAFEEILQYAKNVHPDRDEKEDKIDCLLLGGDLFHSPHPSMDDRLKTREILSKYVLGDNNDSDEKNDSTIDFQMKSDPKLTFMDLPVNFENRDLNVTLPILSIFGNHDEPLSTGVCVLQEFKEYINLFGKRESELNINSSIIDVYPIVLEKNGIKVAIYGINYVRPESVECLELKFHRAKELNSDTERPEVIDCFNIFMVHQDRFRDSIGLFNRELIPEWIDIVLWGHEHQCRITPEVPLDVEKLKCKNDKGGEGSNKVRTIDIIQPGAPIPTSLCQAEAGQKYISKIKIYVSDDGQVSVKYDALPLTLVRPFKFVRQVFRSGTEIKQNDIVEMVKSTLKEEQSTSQPIFLRIRIQSEYSSRQLKQQNLDLNSIWQNLPLKYQNMIANPVNFLLFRKQTAKQRFVNNQLVLDNEADEDDQVEQLGYDIRSMIKTGVEKDEENASLASNVDDLMDSIANKLLSDHVVKSFPSCINPMQFLDSLERAEGIGPTEFSRTMVGCLDGLMDESVGKFVDSLKDEEGEGITTEKFFTQQLRESTWEEMNLEDTTKEMESSITGSFLNQMKSTQVEFRKVMARRFHGKLADELDDPDLADVTTPIIKRMEKITVNNQKNNDKNRKTKTRVIDSDSEEEVIESSLIDESANETNLFSRTSPRRNETVNKNTNVGTPSQISFTGAITSTQKSSKRQKASPPSDTFTKPLPKRTKHNPVVIESDDDDFEIIEESWSERDKKKKESEKTSEANKQVEKENIVPVRSSRSKNQASQRRTFVDDDEEFDFG